jgi:mannose/fructose/N-acetylgalactosamine-specific phosphotransferase system component IIB
MITLVNESAAKTKEISKRINLLKNKALKTSKELIIVVRVSRAITLSEEVGPLTNLNKPIITARAITIKKKLNI